MPVFREYLMKTYAAGPEAIGDFVSSAFVFVRIKQRFWRGYRKAKDANVSIDGLEMDSKKDAVTSPSWKLAPRGLVQEFQMFSTGVEQAVRRYAFSPSESSDDTSVGGASAVLVGGGRHMVDVAVWPQLKTFLRGVAEKWSEAADRWCTEDGHAKLHAHVEDQYGKDIYDRIAGLIPERNTLRSKFGLDIRTAPVRIVDEKSTDESAKEGRRDEIVDLLDLAIRVPREEAAEAWSALSARLATGLNDDWTAVSTEDENRKLKRAIHIRTVTAIRNHTEALSRAERFLDPSLRRFRDLILQEFPADPGVARSVGRTLSTDDAEAIRVGRLLHEAAESARNEDGMCLGLINAGGAKA